MNVALVVSYIIFSLLVAIDARKSRIGFFGVFVASILMTQLVVGILSLLFYPKRKRKGKKKEDID